MRKAMDAALTGLGGYGISDSGQYVCVLSGRITRGPTKTEGRDVHIELSPDEAKEVAHHLSYSAERAEVLNEEKQYDKDRGR